MANDPNVFGDGGADANARAAAMAAAQQKLLNDTNGGNISALGGDLDQFGTAAQNYANPRPEVGGSPGGANAAANYYLAQADAARNRVAPIIDTAAADRIRAQHQATVAGQTAALSPLAAAAAGNGPTAAPGQFGAGLSQAMRDQAAAADAVRGGAGLGVAQAGAQRMGSGAGVVAATGAGQTRAGELAGAQDAYLGGGLGMGAQAIGAQRQDFGQALAQAELIEQQRQLNQQGALGFEGLGQGYELGQLSADANAYGVDVGAQEAAATAAQRQRDALLSGAAGAAAGAGSLYGLTQGKSA